MERETESGGAWPPNFVLLKFLLPSNGLAIDFCQYLICDNVGKLEFFMKTKAVDMAKIVI